MNERYPGFKGSGIKYVLETTHGYYHDDGWGLAACFVDIDSAKKAYEHWEKKSGQYRVVDLDGKIIFSEPNE